MSRSGQSDVVVIARDWSESTVVRFRQILNTSQDALSRLLIVDLCADSSPGDHSHQTLELEDSRVQISRGSGCEAEVAAFNLAFSQRRGDLTLLQDDILVTDAWLAELAETVYSEERTICAVPLITGVCRNEGSGASGAESGQFGLTDLRAVCAGLPRWSTIPAPELVCCYLRGDLIDAVGLLDDTLPTVQLAMVDWVMKAQSLGFFMKRANHAFVSQISSDTVLSQVTPTERLDLKTLAIRHPQLQPQLDRFASSLDGVLVEHAVRLKSKGRLRVAYDLRPLPPQQVGTRTYAVSLVKALAEIDEVELTLLVNTPEQAQGLSGRVMTEQTWKNDVDVIHRPTQIWDISEFPLLFGSSAHLVVTYQDLIGYRIPQVFPGDNIHQKYQAITRISLQGTQRILAYSETTAAEIVNEFYIPRDEVAVVPLGVDLGRFSSYSPSDDSILKGLNLPSRFFFSVATDFPHKNLPRLLEAYSQFRANWRHGACPGLALAGYATGARGAYYRQLESQGELAGITLLGSVSADQLRVLYQRSEALIFPSLYEGFGLPPLEAMAAGTAVIAMPISSVPEVGGDSVLYPDGLSAGALATGMAALATNPALRKQLCDSGQRRVEQFTWGQTALRTLEVYRQAVLQPSPRSIAMRRQLWEGLLSWAEHVSPSRQEREEESVFLDLQSQPFGIRTAWQELHGAVHRRVKREVKRFLPIKNRRSA